MPHSPILSEFLAQNPDLKPRISKIFRTSVNVRASEYHLTNACNIRCEGCWFFEKGMDVETKENKDLAKLEDFVRSEVKERRINTAIVIGGEPTLFPKRLEVFFRHFRNVSISTNGIRKLPKEGFENATIAITLFGAGPIDDQLRGIKPSGQRFTGLFETALKNYRNDQRAGFIIALNQESLPHLEETVKRIADNGNRLIFNYYVDYRQDDGGKGITSALLDKVLCLKERFPQQVLSSSYLIKSVLTGKTHWAGFGYDVCPSVSVDHPDNSKRLANGNAYLPRFNTWSADLKSLKLCCTSGTCATCRDSQAISSMIVANPEKFCASRERMMNWIETAEGYWSQFTWTPYHPSKLSSEMALSA